MTANLDTLEHVARRLGALRPEVVFVGGAVVDLLVSDPGAPPPRMTGDIDAVIEVASRPAYYGFSEKLRALGFTEDRSPGAPLCRWLIDGTKVDLMPSDGAILGFSNRWYAEAIRHARATRLAGGTEVRVITAPYFVATKLEAFLGRGRGDYTASHDLEDVVAVIDGRSELVAEVEAAAGDLRSYLSGQVQKLVQNPRFLDGLPGHLPPDEASQARLSMVLDRLRRLAASA
jgi:predicted nucleotidyltransferase